jgi:hypothetical protein
MPVMLVVHPLARAMFLIAIAPWRLPIACKLWARRSRASHEADRRVFWSMFIFIMLSPC